MLYVTLSMSVLSIMIAAYAAFTISDLSSKLDKFEEISKKLEKKLNALIVDDNDSRELILKRISKIERYKNLK